MVGISSMMLAGGLALAKVQMAGKTITTTKERIDRIKASMAVFKERNGRLPCPAAMNAAPGTAGFGLESSPLLPPGPGGAPRSECSGSAGGTAPLAWAGATVSVKNPQAVISPGNPPGGLPVRIGAVPFATLGLSSQDSVDGWNDRFLYAVSERLADSNVTWLDTNGAITLVNGPGPAVATNTVGPLQDHTPFVVISLGQSGQGAYTYEGVLRGNGPCTAATVNQQENCDMNNAIFRSMAYSNVNTADPARFDNILSNDLATTNPFRICGDQGMIYGPGHPRADANGCLPDMKVGNLADNPAPGGPGPNDGNVGIGTAVPAAKLEIANTLPTQPPLFIRRGWDGAQVQFYYPSTPLSTGEIGLVTGPGAFPNDAANLWIGANLNSTGPGHVTSPLQADPTASSWITRWNGSSDSYQVGRIPPGGVQNAAIYLHINGAGNVGIGTTTPTAKLQVLDGLGSGIYFLGIGGAPTPDAALIHNEGSGLSLRVDDQSSDPTPFVIDQSGNVGIGTATPGLDSLTAKFHVRALRTASDQGGVFLSSPDSIYSIADISFLNETTHTWWSETFRNSAEGGNLEWHVRTNDSPFFSTPGTIALALTPAGNVGIGTRTPAAKLDVQGEVKIGNSGAATLCTATNEGAQRYNSTIKNMEFCNGTAWTPLGGGGGFKGSYTTQGPGGPCTQINPFTGSCTCPGGGGYDMDVTEGRQLHICAP